MKSLVFLLAMIGVAHADRFPDTGPCEDADACEKACKANKKGTCYWGGVLLVQKAVDDESQARAVVLFDKACKTDAEACWQSARIVLHQESKARGDGSKARAAFQRACNKNHARACWQLGVIAAADMKTQKLAATSKAKGVKLLEQRCTKQKMANACAWAADIYEAGDQGIPKDEKKAAALRSKMPQ